MQALTRYRIGEIVRLARDQRVFYVTPANAVCTEQYESFSYERWQIDHLLVRDQVELIEDSVVFGQILVLECFLFAAEHATVGYDAAVFGILHGQVGRAPLLQLGTRYEAGNGARHHVLGVVHGRQRSLGLPPVVVVFADYLEYVAHMKFDARLRARYEIVVVWIVVE